MTMFQFNFSCTKSGNEVNVNQEKQDTTKWFETEQIIPEEVTLRKDINVNSIHFGDYNIHYISDKDVIHALHNKTQNVNNSLLNANQSHSDLITAVYEGGLKIWECTFDLLHFLNKQDIDLTNKKVLDLGCGAGIVGIFSCLNGAETVFQDYNSEVIKFATIPNVSLNNINFKHCKFYCGDWQSFLEKQKEVTKKEKFDYIFTSETIYNTDNYGKILNIFKHLLHKTGIIYLAAKYNYFGVGGNIADFEDLLKKEDIFNYTRCWECKDGVKRVIIKITLK